MVVAEGANTLLRPRMALSRTHPEPIENGCDALIRRHARKIVNQLLSCGAGLPAMLSHAILQHCERRVVSPIPMQFEQQLPRLQGDNYLFEHRTQDPFAPHLPRERVIVPGPTSCGCCGSTKLSKLGEDVTETLEIIPKQWKVIQHVREKFTCRACEKISQAAAPFHVLPRGFAGPSLLAMILFEKYGQHQPLNRQSERYAREGIDLSLSTLADQVGGCATALRPLFALIEAHVLGAERVHGDDSTVPILAKGKTETGRIWVYVRDDKPFGGTAPSAALFYASSDRTREHPERHLSQFTGVFQADAFDGYNRLFLPDRKPSPITEALCWAHSAPISPLAFEAVKRIDTLFDIEREINGLPPEQRLAVRTERSAPLVTALEQWMRAERARLSRHAPVAKALITC